MANSGLTHIDVGPELTRTEWESEQTHQLVHGAAFPGAPVERQLFYRSDLHEWYIYDGTAWVSLQASPMAVHDNAFHSPDFAAEAAFNAHVGNEAAPVHGSAAAATPDKLVHRDAHGRAKVVDPDVDTDIDTRGARNTGIEDHRLGATHALDQPPAAHDNAKHTTNYASDHDLSTHVGSEAAPMHGSTSAATAEKLIHRDNQGRARVAPPSHADDIDTLGGRITGIGVHKAAEVHDLDQPPASHDNAKHSTNYAPLADFNTHAARHELAGADQVSVAGLSGVLADDQPPASHNNARHSTNYASEASLATHEGTADAHKGQKNSVALDVGDLQLLNDQAAPGNNKVYGTSGAGVKGWKDDPAGGGAAAIADGYPVRNGAVPERAFGCIPGIAPVSAGVRALLANFLCYEPMIVSTPIEIDEISLAVSTASAAGAEIRMGIYTADIDWQPVALIVDAGTVDADSIGNKEITLTPAITLPAGRYLKVLITNNTPTTRHLRGNVPSHGMQVPSSTTPFFYRWRKSYTYAVLPTTPEKWDAWDTNNLPFEHVIRVRVSDAAP